MEGPEFERQKANILDALEGARQDYIGATDPVEAEIQMTAIDHLLDVAITSGFLAVDQALEATIPSEQVGKWYNAYGR